MLAHEIDILCAPTHPNFVLIHCIYFSRNVFDEFIAKGGENAHKVVELFC
jgi:hypothetical protein